MTLRPASPPPSRHLTPEPGTDTHTDPEPVPDISHPEPQIDTNDDPITEAETERPDAIPDPSTNQDSPLQDSPLLQDPYFQDELRSETRGKADVSGRRGEVHVEMTDVGLPKLEVVMSPMMIMLRGVGVGPPVWNATRSEYVTGFRSVAGAARAVAATSLIFLTVLSTLAIGSHVLGFRVQNENETAVGRRLKVVGVVIVGGYQINACIQVANTLIAVTRHAHLLTCWNRVIDSQHIPLPPRLRLRCLVQVFFMIFFAAAMVTAAAMGRPRLLAVVLDGLAERLYFIPYTWLSHHPSVTVVRVLVALVAIHHFAINKGVIFYFTTHCHLLTGALATWNTHARHALNEVWAGGWRGATGGGVSGLVGGLLTRRQQLVEMVRDTQTFFSPVLQCYFASTVVSLTTLQVVIVCTELYLLAKGVGSGLLNAEEVMVLVLLTFQTSGLLIHVAFAAASVQEQAEESGEVLCRGLPYDASPQDKFYVDQLTQSLVISPLFISGGNFFTINRSFILTVLSVVASYFIVILQFTQSCEHPSDQSNSNEPIITVTNSTLFSE